MSQKKNEQQNLNLDNCAPNCAVAEQVLSTDKAAKHGLSLLNKLLPLWIVLTMVIGLLIGKFVSGSNVELLPLPLVLSNMFSGKFSYDFSNFLSLGLPLGLFLMIFPAMAKLHLEDAKKAITNFRALGIVLFFTFMVAPFMLWILGNIFLQNYPELWIGLILLGVAPCIAMVLVWTDLAGGNNAIAVVVMVWNSLGQIVTTPIFIWLIIGSKVHIDISLIIEMVLIYLGLPLVVGIATRNILIKHKGHT
ncbi:MAG TPA: arsenic resistance protein, partial [Actinobacteria bacterium]|nr:arsenic resistance protein [Actinomycetes bacterium]HEX21079.1 arsenic resistance protein [Actinomycetota bacterium]